MNASKPEGSFVEHCKQLHHASDKMYRDGEGILNDSLTCLRQTGLHNQHPFANVDPLSLSLSQISLRSANAGFLVATSNFSDGGSDSNSRVYCSDLGQQLSNTCCKLSHYSHPASGLTMWTMSCLAANSRIPTEQYQRVYDWMASSVMPVPGEDTFTEQKVKGTQPWIETPSASADDISGDCEICSPKHGVPGGVVLSLLDSMISIYSLRQPKLEMIPYVSLLPTTPSVAALSHIRSPSLSEGSEGGLPCSRSIFDLHIPADGIREKEVSHVGDSTTCRTDLKLAKKERRQRQKDGNVDEAFADNNVGTSCEDEGMQEILVVPPISTTLPPMGESADDAWATPILQPTRGAFPMTTANKRTNLRRGKRDLMTSWLATPISGDGSGSSPPTLSTPLTSPTTSGPPNFVSEIIPEICTPSTTPTVIPSANSSAGSGISHLFSFLSYNSDENPLSHSTSSGGGQGSVRQSRPREKLESIRARRQLEHSQGNSPPALLDMSLKTTASSFVSSLSTVHEASVDPSVYLGPTSHSTCHQRVTFNEDVYNLDAWDSATMGPFALTTDASIVPLRIYESHECAADSNPPSSALPTFVGVPLVAFQSSPPQAHSQSQSTCNTAVFPRSFSNTSSNTQEYFTIAPLYRLLSPILLSSVSTASTTFNTEVPPRGAVDGVSSLSGVSSNRAYLYQVGVRHATSVFPSILVTNRCFTNTAPRHLRGARATVSPSSSLEGTVHHEWVRLRSRDTSLMAFSGLITQGSSTFSEIVSRYVTVDTLVHTATSYTHQLANPTSGAGHRKFRREQERWLTAPEP